MSNNRFSLLSVLALTLGLGITGFSISSYAQSNQPTVTNIIIDKTDKNAVVARDHAIIDAQRTAFQVLAQQSMGADAYKSYKLPDDKTIISLVDDFEIKNEQMSSNRYMASFTVKFSSNISGFLKIPDGLTTIAAPAPVASTAAAAPVVTDAPSAAPPSTPLHTAKDAHVLVAPAGAVKVKPDTKTAATPAPETAPAAVAITPAAVSAPAAEVATAPRNILVLPYYQDAAGKKVLWEDPNPWRDAWQETGSTTPAPNVTLSVPLGDLTDLASGNTDAVWTNDFATIEKSRANYNATEVALVVAHPAAEKGAKATVDVFLYKDGKLEHKKSVNYVYVDTESYKQAISRVSAALQSPRALAAFDKAATDKATADARPAVVVDTSATPSVIPPATADVAPAAALETPSAVSVPAETNGKVAVEATMNFGSYQQWMDAQKRLASITPPLEIEISSLSKDSAQFTLNYDGGMEAFKTALAGKGLTLNQPVVEVDESVLGSAAPTQHMVYELKLN